MWLAGVLVTILVGLLAFLDMKKPKNYPPGPMWWPILGCALAVEKMRRKKRTLCMATTELARQYAEGKLIGLRVGNDYQVVVTSAELVREMATKTELDGRPMGPFFRFRTWGLRRGVLLVDGDFWREQRRFLMRHLRDFGWGKSSAMEVIINREVNALMDYFKTAVSNAPCGVATVPLHDAFGVSMLNSIWAMLAGQRYDPDDIEMRKLQRILSDLFASMDMTGCLFNQFPLLRFIAPEISGYSQYMRTHKALWTFLQEELLRHEANHVPGVTRDFMDVYLMELRNLGYDPTSTFSELQLMAICMDMFMAGSDTTNKSLSFAFLHFLREPLVVKKIQEEMDRVVGRERMPTLEDRANLPYVEATVLETLRTFSGHSFALPHRALQDSTLGGYFIPKNTTVAINLNGFHMNEELWDQPWEFRPDRFLDENNQIKVPDYFLPFGLGRRRCIGDTLAKTNLYLFISNLLHTFNFRNAKGEPLPDPFPLEGITPTTQPYEGEISLRNN